MAFLIVNGPNLNRLGQREPEIYGFQTLGDIEQELKAEFSLLELEFFQSNIEGELIDCLQAAEDNPNIKGIVFNAGAYSHTSIALADCIKGMSTPVVLVHISNVYQREIERHTDLLLAAATGCITGLGTKGYGLAVRFFLGLDAR